MDDEAIFELELELLLEALYRRYQYDFRHYSRAFLQRRLVQALATLECATLSQLQERLLREPRLLPRVLEAITVPTTELFRDPGYFRVLRQEVVPLLRTYPSLKVWVAGCSTGEEVWSLAILLKEEGLHDKAIIYATDIIQSRLQKAKRGIYRSGAMRAASRSYRDAGGKGSLSDYYSAAYDAVRLDPSLVSNVVFSDHNLATDAVFAEVHLVSCRNVLIYFDRKLQDRAIGLFRDSLVRLGFLGLGSKETINFSRHKEDFDVVSQEERVYRRR
jgi:chemotaxis protein methyltransferase CheR